MENEWGELKLSVEAKVAAAVAAGFISLTAATIGQGGSDAQNTGPDLEKNSEIPANASRLRYSSSPNGRTNTGENRHTSSGDVATTAGSGNVRQTSCGRSDCSEVNPFLRLINCVVSAC